MKALEFFASEAGKKLVRLFWTSTSERYGLLTRLGLSDLIINNLDLSGTPIIAAIEVSTAVEKNGWTREEIDRFSKAVMDEPLPQWAG